MSKIRFFTRNQINDKKWNELIEKSTVSLVYAYTWYLDNVCDQWAAIVYGNYEAVMPIPMRKKWGIFTYVYQPPFVQRLGVFGNTVYQEKLFKSLPKSILLSNLYVNKIENTASRKNFILELNKPYLELEKKFNKDAHKNLRKLVNYTIEDANHHECINLYKETWGKLNPYITAKNYDDFERVCDNANKLGKLKCVQMHNEGEVLAMAIWLYSGNRIHNLCAAITPKGKAVGAMHGLIDYAMKTNSNSKWIFDFEGSEIETVAKFYLKFAPQVEMYSHFKKWLPGWH